MVHPRLVQAARSPLLAASPHRQPKHHVRSSSISISPSLTDSRIAGLRHALLNASSPARVWAHYTNLVSYFNHDVLPLELHQQVLRQCSPLARTVGLSAAIRLIQGKKPENPHLYEGRFQTVVSNIRAMGLSPSLEDYHFILEQFSAVGHYIGSIQVYQEIIHLGLTPEPKTFGLCLQAIAHRLTLPILKFYRPRLIAQTRKILDDLMVDMRKYHVPFTSTNLELALRIFKETVDEEGFNTLVKWTYGIDLANPDCSPLELLHGQSNSHSHSTQPLTTDGLNTIIDTLGRFRNISKLVQAFEILTQPLPRANQHLFSTFDDDDDFGIPVEVPTPSNFTPPFARPNTTTYNMLLHHVAQANHPVLARHYLIQAMKLDREVHHQLWSHIEGGGALEDLKAPHFALTRRMLLSVFGHTNRRKNLGLMRWLSTKMERILRTKRMDLEYFTKLRDTLGAPLSQSFVDALADIETPFSMPSRDFISLRPLVVPSRRTASSTVEVDPQKLGTAFDVDVSNQTMPEPTTEKMFDLDLHILILTRDLKQITDFALKLDQVLGRTMQRRKEWLGRRVWANKDIYLLTADKRLQVSRERWREIVRFRPRRELLARPPVIYRHVPPSLQRPRSFSSLAKPLADTNQILWWNTLVTKFCSILPP